jgi:hypothetical protein
VKPQRVFLYLNDIDRVRRNIIKMMILCSRNTLYDDCVTFVQCPHDESIKNRKIEKNEKNMFFLNLWTRQNKSSLLSLSIKSVMYR